MQPAPLWKPTTSPVHVRSVLSVGLASRTGPNRPRPLLLENALSAVEGAGFQLHPDQFAVYGEHMLAIAASEISNIPTDPAEAVKYAVLGTVLFEPVLAAIRRLAQQSLVKRGLDT